MCVRNSILGCIDLTLWPGMAHWANSFTYHLICLTTLLSQLTLFCRDIVKLFDLPLEIKVVFLCQ